jgi:opacity protein-like surface antigen
MPRNIAIVLGCAVVALSLAATSQAATVIDFTDYAGSPPAGDTIDLGGGKTVSLDAFDSWGFNRDVLYTNYGLGAKGWIFDSGQIDGLGQNETLRMTFSEQITFVGFQLSWVGLDDDARVIIDYDFGNPVDYNLFGLGPAPKLALNEVGTTFDFTVVHNNDDYFIKGIKIADAPGGTPIGVPAPAALLAGGGLLGLIVGRRRR